MAQDKIEVDEPLISTDVDRMIRTIAEKKKVSLNELRRVCSLDKRNMEKWIMVLEDEGYISLEYGIRGTYVHWKGDDITNGYEDSEEVTYADYEDFQPATEKAVEEKEPEPPAEDNAAEEPAEEEAKENEFSQELPLEEEDEADPEELLNTYLARKRENKETDIEELKSSILTRLEEEEKKAAEEQSEAPPEEPPEPDDSDDSEEPDAEPEAPEPEPELDFTKLDDTGPAEPQEILKPTIQPKRALASDIRELMGSYMDEINKEKATIQALKKEKESLYRDKIATLEGRMQADLVALTEKIIEKQSRVAELKERVLELPDKVEEVERVQAQMDALKQESGAALARTRERADVFIADVMQSRDEVRERIEDLNSSIKEQSDRLVQLEKKGDSLEERADELKESVEEAQSKVEELNSAMSALSEDLAKVEGMRTEIAEAKDALVDTVASHGEELQALEAELEEIAKVEQWVAEYVRDYESKISDIESYVTQSDEELAELKQAAESLYMKKYLGELADMTDAYETGLEDAIATERDIDEKMAASKKRITELVNESKEMMRKLQSEVSDDEPDDYDKVLAKVKKKTSKAKKVVEEKRKEREKLTEDARRTRKSKRTEKTRKAKEKVKVKKKPKKKRRR